MKSTVKNTDTGHLRVSYKAMGEIASRTISEIQGVASLAPRPVSVRELVLKTAADKPFKITINGDVACVDVAVNLKFGYKIKRVTEEIQEKVKEAIQSMTGIAVAKVNVYIAGVLSE